MLSSGREDHNVTKFIKLTTVDSLTVLISINHIVSILRVGNETWVATTGDGKFTVAESVDEVMKKISG